MLPKLIIISILGTLTVIVGFSFAMTAGQKPIPKEVTYASSNPDRPKAEVKNSSSDLGKMKVTDVKSSKFMFKNSGTKPLQVLNINSSCGCTTGKIIYKDFISKEYGMHSQSGFVTEIAPGDTAKVIVTYRPYSMPVYGTVVREVYITTNDPLNPRLVFSVKAFVE